MSKLATVEMKVVVILARFPEARDNDKFLIQQYLATYHNIRTFAEHTASADAPTTESIRRCRQKIQEAGKYLPSAKAQQARASQEREFLEYAVGEK